MAAVVRICYSNRTEALLAALVRNLRDERARRGPFLPAHVVVPNRNVETFLKLGLAQATGIAANLDVTFLRRLLGRIAERALPEGRVVDVTQIEGHLLRLFHDEIYLAAADLVPVREYLEAAGTRPEAVDRRRCQLAAELAQLFDEYAVSRPEMLAGWTAGRLAVSDDPVYAATEVWQRALWRAVFADDGLVAERSRREGVLWRPLFELLAEADRRGQITPRIVGDAVHVFGVSYVARGYHRMLALVGRHVDVWIYTLNPCREFWEDVETVGELRRQRTKFSARHQARQPDLALGEDPLGLAGEGENLALRLWGRPGRENVRLLNQLTESDFEGQFVPSDGRTLLGRLQDEILDRAVRTAPDPTVRADGSVRLLPCPGVRRELEVVAAEIWRLVRADPTLRFNDVAVIVPDARKDLYLSHVGAVFGEAHGLPHSVLDLPLGDGHRLGEAALRLLALPLGGFSRRELLPLLLHPSVMAGFPDASPQLWLRLCDELGIVHGADRGDHQGTYIERDLFNWDQGLRRLALGALMTGPRSGDEAPVTFGSDSYLPAERPPDEEPAALAFALLVRSLIQDARFARGEGGVPALRPFGEWLEFMRGLLGSYLVPADDDEGALLGRCLRTLQELEALDLGDLPISYRVAAELARRALARLGGARGQYLARGATVASFVPMRAIPFRAVFVLGLGHGIFPRATRRGPLDLRDVRRLPGDVTPREQDLYMFLETLLCARDFITLSYVARDELTGVALPPSSVVLELREILARLLPPGELAALFDEPQPPLRRYDDHGRLFALPLARRENVAKVLGRSLRDALPAGAALPDLPTLRRMLPAEARVTLEAHLSIHVPPPRSATAGSERLVVPLVAIRQFLEDPLQGSARFRLRMREIEGEEVLALREGEAFETDASGRAALLRETFVRALIEVPPSWEAVARRYATVALRDELLGRSPTGLFREAERGGHEAILRGWLEEIVAFGGPAFGRSVVRFGRASENEPVGESHEPILLDVHDPEGRPLRVEIVGRTELLVTPPGGEPGSVVLTSRKNDDEIKRSKDRLRAFVDHLALAAAGVDAGPHLALGAWSTGAQRKLHRSRFCAVAPERARAYLAAIVRDMLTGARDAEGRATGVHDYLLPCEAIFLARKGGRPVAEEVEKLRDHYFEKHGLPFSSVLGPVPEAVERHDPPPSEEAERLTAARFSLYFELLEGPA